MIAESIPSIAAAPRGASENPALFVLGTPDATWEPLARAIWSLAGLDRAGGIKPAGWAELQTFDTVDVHARFIVLVDSPAEAAGHALAAGGRLGEALSRWRQGARQLLLHAQRRPGRCLFLHASEAWAAPEALREALTRFDADLVGATPEWPPRPQLDPILLALTEAAVSADTALQRLSAEVHASCVVLSEAASFRPPTATGDLSAAIEHYVRLQAELAAESRRADALKEASDRLAKEMDQAVQRQALANDQLQARFETSQRDVELLRLQVQQAQEELDAVYDRLSHAITELPHAALRAHADAMRMIDVVEAAPHKHLHVNLRQLRIGVRQWASLELRLLEHHGRPGIAYFATGSAPEVLCAWRASGKENGRDYMLLVPSDVTGQSLLANLGSGDWQTVRGSVDVLVRSLRQVEGDTATRWSSVALRLQSQIDAMAPRLRYDTLGAQSEPADPGWLRVCFGEVTFGVRDLGNVALRWHLASGKLRWLAPTDGTAVPLASWPARQDGMLELELGLPLGRARATEKRDWWSGLADADREVVLGLLDALPAALGSLPEDRLPAGWSIPAALRAARALQRDARRNLSSLRLRRAVRRLLRRVAAANP